MTRSTCWNLSYRYYNQEIVSAWWDKHARILQISDETDGGTFFRPCISNIGCAFAGKLCIDSHESRLLLPMLWRGVKSSNWIRYCVPVPHSGFKALVGKPENAPFSFQVWIRLGCAGYAANASRNPHRWPGMSVIVWFSNKSVWIRKC